MSMRFSCKISVRTFPRACGKSHKASNHENTCWFLHFLVCTQTKISEPLNIVITETAIWCPYIFGPTVQDEVAKTGSWYDYVFHASLNTKMGSVEVNYIFGLNNRPLNLLQHKVHSQCLCRLNRDQIWRLQVVGNISKSSDQLKFNRSLYFSLLLYHRSCSSFDFFGIVIVNVCFFPGADFLLNRALDSCWVSGNERIQFRK